VPPKGPVLGLVSFTDPRATAFALRRERYLEGRHQALKKALQQRGIRVVDPQARLRKGWRQAFGIRRPDEVEQCIRIMQAGGAQAVVLGCWHWTEPMLPLSLARDFQCPIALYAQDDPAWAGSVCLGAVGASLWEAGISPYALTHVRFRSDPDGLAQWARGVCALQALRHSTLVLWGGSYCLRMEHLQDDVPELKRLLVGDMLTEDEYVLVRGAETILAKSPRRIQAFLRWFARYGGKIEHDKKMATPASVRRQVALYLAARDRLRELESEGHSVGGVSVRCQPELSEVWACTACTLPSFLPYPADAEGPQRIVPTVCEGDIKGLVTSTLLHLLAPDVPPLFGDLKYVTDDLLIISNCGGSSIWYASRSGDPAKTLPAVRLAAQCQGASGAAVGYEGAPGELTVARLIRFDREYVMQLGVGRAVPVDRSVRSRIVWGQTWPHIAISLGVSGQALMAAIGSNHLSATAGDHTAEITHACKQADIPIVRLDSEESLHSFPEML